MSGWKAPWDQAIPFDDVIRRMARDSQVSPAVLADVLERVMISSPEPVARIHIAAGHMRRGELTPISAGTVSKATRALVDEGFLAEDPRQDGGPGRPTVPLRLGAGPARSVRRALVGVHVELEGDRRANLLAVLTALDGTVVLPAAPLRKVRSKARADHLRDVLDAIHRSVEDILTALDDGPPAERYEILGVGVGVSGHVHEGFIVEVSRAGWPSFDMASELSERLRGLSVIVDNNVNVLAMLETYTPGPRERHLAMIAVSEHGVGGALVVDGRVYRGAGGMAGEIGHVRVPSELADRGDAAPARAKGRRYLGFSDPCDCGKSFHLECFSNLSRIKGELGLTSASGLAVAAASGAVTPRGEPTPEASVFFRAGAALGFGIAGLVNVFNPGAVVLLLPRLLEGAAEGSAAGEYRRAVEWTLDQEALSTGAEFARTGGKNLRVEAFSPSLASVETARAAALCVLDAFVKRSRGYDRAQDAD